MRGPFFGLRYIRGMIHFHMTQFFQWTRATATTQCYSTADQISSQRTKSLQAAMAGCNKLKLSKTFFPGMVRQGCMFQASEMQWKLPAWKAVCSVCKWDKRAHQNSPSSSTFSPSLFFSFSEIWLHSLDLTREGAGWGKEDRGGGREKKKEKDEKYRQEGGGEREGKGEEGKVTGGEEGREMKGSTIEGTSLRPYNCFCPKLWSFECSRSKNIVFLVQN